MDLLPSLLFSALGLWMALCLIRHFRRGRQVMPAVRQMLSERSATLLRIRRTVVFRDCGSAWAAFVSSHSLRDYDARYRAADGSEHWDAVTARFHPISMTLRDIRFLKDDAPANDRSSSREG